MKSLLAALLFACLSLHAATYYVSSTGNDFTGDGSSGNPWLTLAHSLGQMHCGDTLDVIANGSFVQMDSTLPYFANCGQVTTIESSNWSSFSPTGYRTNPTIDAANYGRLQAASQGILAYSEAHGANAGQGWIWGAGSINTCFIASLAADTFTMGACGPSAWNIANGTMVMLDVNSTPNTIPAGGIFNIPSPLVLGKAYYVVNCMSCGTANTGTFQLSATSAGPPITGMACSVAGNNCLDSHLLLTVPIQVVVGSATLTIGDSTANWTNGTPVTVGAVCQQIYGTLPNPLQTETLYYLVNVSGRNFGLAPAPGGSAIVMTSLPTCGLVASVANVPHSWAFRGLEFTDNNSIIYGFVQVGSGGEASWVTGVPHHFEFDHVYIHELNAGEASPPLRGLAINGNYINIHDSYCTGIINTASDSQCFGGWSTHGPVTITNTFSAAGSENSLSGGNVPMSGTPDLNWTFEGNYFYKPPSWKITSGTVDPAGSCWYDTFDTTHSGGEFYHNTMTSVWWQCGADHAWHSGAAAPAYGPTTFKDLTEHKNGCHFLYVGNRYAYSPTGAQAGETWNNAAEYNSGPGSVNCNVTIMNNAVYHVYRVKTPGQAYYGQSGSNLNPALLPPANHVTLNNLFVIDPEACGVNSGAVGCGYAPFQNGWQSYGATSSLQGDIQAHNTFYAPDSGFPSSLTIMQTGSPTGGNPPFAWPAVNYEAFINNLAVGDVLGDSVTVGAVVANYYTNALFSHFACKTCTSSGYGSVGTGNTWSSVAYPADNTAIKFVNATGDETGDYHLASSSPYSAQNGSATLLSTDGTDLGADIDLVNMATSGARAGTPPVDQLAHLQVIPGSTRMVFSLQSLTGGTCTVTLYNAPARIAANQVAQKADTAADAVSQGSQRQIPFDSLTASTQYWYSVTGCTSVPLVSAPGGVYTRATGSGTYYSQWNFPSSTAMQYSSSISGGALVSPTVLSAAPVQSIPAASNAKVYAQIGTAGAITILVDP